MALLTRSEKRRIRYAQDPEYRERILAAARSRAPRAKESRRQKMKSDPEFREKERKSRLDKFLVGTYGLTRADYDLMVAVQGGLCAMCQRRPRQKLCVDHDHATRRLRFLLCRKCNLGFGYYDEDPDVLRRAADYAEFWRKVVALGVASRLVPDRSSRKRRRRADRPALAPRHCPTVPNPICAGRGTAGTAAMKPVPLSHVPGAQQVGQPRRMGGAPARSRASSTRIRSRACARSDRAIPINTLAAGN
jgi:hypothetical protein